MKRIVFVLLLSFITLTLPGCKGQISENAYDDFIRKLEDMNFNVTEEDAGKDILEGERKWVTVDETENLSVYLYESNQHMEKDASFIDAGGTGYHNGRNSVEVSWVSYPHFYKTENIIVLYVGKNDDIIDAVEKIIGEQFAGY